MQARPKIVKILVVALLVSLILAACGGGSTGSTWFNLPSVKVRIQPDGAMRVWGFNVGYFPQPALIQQMQGANIQQLEVRIGYNGIHIYANGQDLPYINWDEPSVNTVQGVLPRLPNVPNANTIAGLLPWLRTIGMGVMLDLPLAQGQSELNIPRWRGETSITPSTPAEPTIGPITIGSLTFDETGAALIEGVPAAELEQALGMSLPLALDPNTLALLQSLGAENFEIYIFSNGIELSLNGQPLPGVAWDAAHLDTLATYIPAFVSDPALVETINEALPLLAGADVRVNISFTGEQTVDTALSTIRLAANENGDLSLAGIPIAPAVIPADALASLQAANIQQIDLSVLPTGINIAANGQSLPTISWTEESLPVLASVVGPMAGGEGLINTVLPIALGLGPSVQLSLPVAEGAEAVEIPDEISYIIQPVEMAEGAPVINLTLGIDAAGNIVSLGSFSADNFASLGINLPSVPADSLNALRAAGVQAVTLDTEPGVLNVVLDGETALALNFDGPSITTALNLAQPFLQDTPISEPAVNQLLRDVILPVVLTSNVDITIDFK